MKAAACSDGRQKIGALGTSDSRRSARMPVAQSRSSAVTGRTLTATRQLAPMTGGGVLITTNAEQ